MNKNILLLASVAAFALSAPAFADDKVKYESKTKVEADAKGNYEETTKTTKVDEAGTKTSLKKDVDVDVNRDGTVDKVVKTTVVEDPKGLFNKTKTKTVDKEESETDGTVTTSHKKTVDGKVVVDTEITHK